MKSDYDVIVAGGGMTGLATALLLARSRLRVALIEPEPPAADAAGRGDWALRVSALNLASCQLLTSLDLWSGIAARRQTPYRRIRVVDGGSDGAISFDATELGVSALGTVVENDIVRQALWDSMAGNDSVELHAAVYPESLQVADERVRLQLNRGQTITARLLVAADGYPSQIAQLARIDVRRRDYQQLALVATLEPQQHHGFAAWQRFLPGGPVAWLPLADGAVSLVWSLATADAERLLASSDREFVAALEQATDHHLGGVKWISSRAAFPLVAAASERYVGRRVALVGDAAHRIHPLAGQGVNLGFQDGAALAELIGRAVATGRDPGGDALLLRYQRWRRGVNQPMMVAMDLFHHLFTSRSNAVAIARGLGMLSVDALLPLKGWFARHGAGMGSELPQVMRVPFDGLDLWSGWSPGR